MKPKYSQGFTLIEMTVVLFILALLLGSFLVPLATRVEQKERENTQIQLDEIEAAIHGFVLQNNRLPCPDCALVGTTCVNTITNDGEADVNNTTGACLVNQGNLPWVTLGVQKSDAWGNEFTYRVDGEFADTTDDTTGTPNCAATLNVSFSLCSDGDITVRDSVGGANVAMNIPAIIVSHGKNFSNNAVSLPLSDEEENLDNDANFVDRDYSLEVNNEFDDMLLWISPHVLRTMAVRSGILP